MADRNPDSYRDVTGQGGEAFSAVAKRKRGRTFCSPGIVIMLTVLAGGPGATCSRDLSWKDEPDKTVTKTFIYCPY